LIIERRGLSRQSEKGKGRLLIPGHDYAVGKKAKLASLSRMREGPNRKEISSQGPKCRGSQKKRGTGENGQPERRHSLKRGDNCAGLIFGGESNRKNGVTEEANRRIKGFCRGGAGVWKHHEKHAFRCDSKIGGTKSKLPDPIVMRGTPGAIHWWRNTRSRRGKDKLNPRQEGEYTFTPGRTNRPKAIVARGGTTRGEGADLKRKNDTLGMGLAKRRGV